MVGDGRANRLTVTERPRRPDRRRRQRRARGRHRSTTCMRARDGSPDTILCGAGTDTVEADTLDIVSTTCENVSTQATPGGPFDDHPPLIAWTAPAAGATLSANEPTTLSVERDRRPRPRARAVLRRRPAAVRGHHGAVLVRVPAARRRRRPQHAAGGRDRRREPDDDARAPGHRAALHAAEPRCSRCARAATAGRPTRSASPGSCAAEPRWRRPRAAPATVTITAKAGSRTATTRRVKLSRNCEYAPDAALPHAAREPAAPDAASAATKCWPRRRRGRRTIRLG